MVKPKDISYLPNSFGCYLFKNKEGQVIYVGKANPLLRRRRQHLGRGSDFSQPEPLSEPVVNHA